MTDQAAHDHRLSTTSSHGLLSLAAAAAFPATWWILGRLDQSDDWNNGVDYAVKPPQIDRTLAHAIGAGSVVLSLIGVIVLIALIWNGRWRWGVAAMYGAAVAGFAYAGLAAHVMTAPVIGANIGAGILVVAGLPVGLVLFGIGWGGAKFGR